MAAGEFSIFCPRAWGLGTSAHTVPCGAGQEGGKDEPLPFLRT